MNRYFHTGGPMPKVGSVAHQLYGQGCPQFVKAEEFDRLAEERNALQATVEWQGLEAAQFKALLFVSWLVSVGLLIALAVALLRSCPQ